MSRYLKAIEAYRLGEGEKPEWFKKAIKEKTIDFKRQDMIDIDTFKECKNAIVGIKRAGQDRVYDIDSYIVYDNFDNSIKVIDAYDFEQQGFQKVD